MAGRRQGKHHQADNRRGCADGDPRRYGAVVVVPVVAVAAAPVAVDVYVSVLDVRPVAPLDVRAVTAVVPAVIAAVAVVGRGRAAALDVRGRRGPLIVPP